MSRELLVFSLLLSPEVEYYSSRTYVKQLVEIEVFIEAWMNDDGRFLMKKKEREEEEEETKGSLLVFLSFFNDSK